MNEPASRRDTPARVIAAIAICVSFLSAAISAYSAYFARLSALSAVANIRPMLDTEIVEAAFDQERCKVSARVRNIGRTVAVVKSMHWVSWAAGGRSCYYEFDVAGALILPSGEMIKTLSNVSRLQECGDVKYDVSKGYNGKGRASIELVYSSRELPGQEFSEGTFIPVSWIDKSSKRLGINDPK